ncbi:hypothetical protein AZE42_12882 [Rhizopogon vesiculosus]|uniref:Uncharacterized protein n=1 Tax=Rhizopogon vesiculosus TaxID=180088 RepID=A0A1J8PLJ3_9AGAM|nr:hypothetical protein AZE42_12882 [Rhizopogon vesiculosus]
MALEAIEKLLQSEKTTFIGGSSGLQAKRACTIQSHLALINVQPKVMDLHWQWGGRQLHSWTHNWVLKQELPQSLAGQYA